MRNIIIFLYNLSLKKALALSLLFALFLSIPLIYLQSQRESRIFTEAGNQETVEEVDESNIPYPDQPPELVHVERFYGRPGDSVLLFGENFGQAQKESQVLLNNKPIDDSLVHFWSDSEIEFSLPEAEGIYEVGVNINNQRASWFGKINIFNSLTTNELTIEDSANLVRVENGEDVSLNVYSLLGDVNVIGTEDFEITEVSVPVDLTSSNILYVEMFRNGRPVSFKVN